MFYFHRNTSTGVGYLRWCAGLIVMAVSWQVCTSSNNFTQVNEHRESFLGMCDGIRLHFAYDFPEFGTYLGPNIVAHHKKILQKKSGKGAHFFFFNYPLKIRSIPHPDTNIDEVYKKIRPNQQHR